MFKSGSYRQTTLAPIDPWTETEDQWSGTSVQWAETGLWNHSYTPLFTTSQNASRTVVPSSTSKNGQLIFLIFLFVFIVIGNLSVLLALGLSKRGKKSFRMNYFIMNLALADLLVALVSVLTDIIWKITLHWYAGDVICKTVRYLQAVVTYASTYVLVALSIDRLDAIARPMNFSGGNVRAKVLIALAWLSAGVFSIPMLVINKEMVRRQDGSKQCRIVFGERWNWQVYMTVIATVLFVIPALIITTCYLIIIYVIWTKSKLLGAPVQSVRTPSTSARLLWRRNTAEDDVKVRKRTLTEVTSVSSAGVIPKAKIRTIKMTFLIVLIFILCWSPYFVFDLLDVYGLIPNGHARLTISFFVQSLAPLNSAANPLIYGFFSSRLCQNLRRLPCFKTFGHRRSRHHHHPNHPLNNRRRCCVCCCCCCCPPQPSSTAHDRNPSFCLSTYALPSTTSYDHMVSVGPAAGAGPAGVDLKDLLCLNSRARASTSNHRLQTRLDGGSPAETRTAAVTKRSSMAQLPNTHGHNHQVPRAGEGLE